jgi:hypothetical protein
VIALWFANILISRGESLEGVRSIQLPTTEAQSIAKTVEVIPLEYMLTRDLAMERELYRIEVAMRVFGNARATRRI